MTSHYRITYSIVCVHWQINIKRLRYYYRLHFSWANILKFYLDVVYKYGIKVKNKLSYNYIIIVLSRFVHHSLVIHIVILYYLQEHLLANI